MSYLHFTNVNGNKRQASFGKKISVFRVAVVSVEMSLQKISIFEVVTVSVEMSLGWSSSANRTQKTLILDIFYFAGCLCFLSCSLIFFVSKSTQNMCPTSSYICQNRKQAK